MILPEQPRTPTFASLGVSPLTRNPQMCKVGAGATMAAGEPVGFAKASHPSRRQWLDIDACLLGETANGEFAVHERLLL